MKGNVKNRMLQALLILFCLVLLVAISNVILIATSGESVQAPSITRQTRTIGQGKSLHYLVLGDSTAIAQGGDYEQGYVVQTAKKIAQDYTVRYANLAVSGATIGDVYDNQLMSGIETMKPDLVLVAAGANDVTHLSSLKSIEVHLENIIDVIKQANPDVQIIFTGSASMGDIKRFPPPTNWLAGLRTGQINSVFETVITRYENVTFARIAEKTGEAFANNDSYFAADNFHPSNEGYQEWSRVLNTTIESVLE